MLNTRQNTQLHASLEQISSNEKIIKILLFSILLFCVFLVALVAVRGNVIFHTDIARDFLLIEDIVTNKKLTLIGPRSGGIPGVFHGPLWLYLNIPFYLLGGGDPSVVGIGWALIWCASLCLLWYCAKLLTRDTITSLIIATYYALLTFAGTINYFNPSGALLVTPFWFMSLVMYTRNGQFRYVFLIYLLLGIIIQFQMALGIPLMVLSSFLVIRDIIQRKRWAHITAFMALLPFISTYILFDLRHNFLQFSSVYQYLFGAVEHGKSSLPFIPFLFERLHASRVELSNALTNNAFSTDFILLLIGLAFGYSLAQQAKKSHILNILPDYVKIFLYIWFGYWMVTFPYKGVMWGYYYSPLLPVIVIAFVGFIRWAFARNGALILTCVCMMMFPIGWVSYTYNPPKIDALTMGDWLFLRSNTEQIMFSKNAPKEFGYFVFTRDQLGYSQTYTLHFLAKQHTDFKVHPLEKKRITYLLIDTEPHPVANKDYWKSEQVNIKTPPKNVFKLDSHHIIEQYELEDDEINAPIDPNLIQNLIFR